MLDVKSDYDALRARHAAKHDRPLLTLEHARANATPIAWAGYHPPRTHLLLQQEKDVSPVVWHQGKTQHVRVYRHYPIEELRRYIDWQPFFNAWEMKGRFPDILNNPATGETARKLYDDAQTMLDSMIKEKWVTANGVIGFFPANAVGDDIEVSVLSIMGEKVRIGIQAPRDIPVFRKEVYLEIQQENVAAGASARAEVDDALKRLSSKG